MCRAEPSLHTSPFFSIFFLAQGHLDSVPAPAAVSEDFSLSLASVGTAINIHIFFFTNCTIYSADIFALILYVHTHAGA